MPNLPAQLTEEEKELQEVLSRISSYPKLSRWVQLFLDITNKVTYGNRTQSALVAYELNPETQYFSAATIGKENFKKLQTIAAEYYEKSGMTAGKQLELLAAKAVGTNNAKFLQMLMEISGTYTPKPLVAIQNNINNNNVQITPEKSAEFKKEFTDFINAKYSTPTLNPDTTEVTPG